MKSKKPKKSKKIKLDLFQKVCFKPKSAEMAVLVLICAAVFGVSFLGSGKLLYDHGQKKIKSAPSSQPEIQIMKSAVAAENQTNENAPGAEEDASLKEKKDPKAVFVEVNITKDQAEKEAKAKILAKQRAAEIAAAHAAEAALINSAPVLAGPTSRLPDGKRVCPLKNPHPSGRGGKPHIDEDCCADYDEYPNPRCEYSPAQMAALKKQ